MLSGIDESRPVCSGSACSPKYREGLDNRRLIARGDNGYNIMQFNSIWEENFTGIRLVRFAVPNNDSGVIKYIYCASCGNSMYGEEFISGVKRYIYLYEKNFGMDYPLYQNLYNKLAYGKETRAAPEYDEYTAVDDTCDGCGYSSDECECSDDECSSCHNSLDSCTCCDNCGNNREYCDCYCNECGMLNENCECDED